MLILSDVDKNIFFADYSFYIFYRMDKRALCSNNFSFFFLSRIAHWKRHHKTVFLSFRQREGSFWFNRIFCSKNKERQPQTIEGKIVQDADRIDAIGAVGIARTFAYGGKAGRTLESSLQHFNDKLLLLKDKMNTQEAKRIAESRHLYMEEFLSKFQEETKI